MASSSHGGRRPRGESPFVLRSQCQGKNCLEPATPSHTHRHSRRSSRLGNTAPVEANGLVPNGAHHPPGSPRLDAFDGQDWVRSPRTGYTYAESQTYRDLYAKEEVPMPHMARLPLWQNGERPSRAEVHLELVETCESSLTRGIRTAVYAIPAWCSLLDTYLLTRKSPGQVKDEVDDDDEEELVIVRQRRVINVINNFWRQVKKSPKAVLQSSPVQKVISKVPGGTQRDDSPWFLLWLFPLLMLFLVLVFPSDTISYPVALLGNGISGVIEWTRSAFSHAGLISVDLFNGLVHFSSTAFDFVINLVGSFLNMSSNILSAIPKQLLSLGETWITTPLAVILNGITHGVASLASFQWIPSTGFMKHITYFASNSFDFVCSILRLPLDGLLLVLDLGIDWASWIVNSCYQFIMDWVEMLANVFRAIFSLVLDVFTLVISIPSYIFTGIIWAVRLPFTLASSAVNSMVNSDFVENVQIVISGVPTQVASVSMTCMTMAGSVLETFLTFPKFLAQSVIDLTVDVSSGLWNGLLSVASMFWSIPLLLFSWLKVLAQLPILAGGLMNDLVLDLFTSMKEFTVYSFQASSSALEQVNDFLVDTGSSVGQSAQYLTTTLFSTITSMPSFVLPWASLIIEAPVLVVRCLLSSLGDNIILDASGRSLTWMWDMLKNLGGLPLTLGQNVVQIVSSAGNSTLAFMANIMDLPWASLIIEAPVLMIQGFLLYLTDNVIIDAFRAFFDWSLETAITVIEYPINLGSWTINSVASSCGYLWDASINIGSFFASLPRLILPWISSVVETPISFAQSLIDSGIIIIGSLLSVPLSMADLSIQGISWVGTTVESGVTSFSHGILSVVQDATTTFGSVGIALWNLPFVAFQSIWDMTGKLLETSFGFWSLIDHCQAISKSFLIGCVDGMSSLSQSTFNFLMQPFEILTWPFVKSFELIGSLGRQLGELTTSLSEVPEKITETGGMALSSLGVALVGIWNWFFHGPIEDLDKTKKASVIDAKIQRLINLDMLETKVNDMLKKGFSDWEAKFQNDLEITPTFLGIKSLSEKSFVMNYPQFELEKPNLSLTLRDLNLEPIVDDEKHTKEDYYLTKDQLLTKLNALKELFMTLNDQTLNCCDKSALPSWISDAGMKSLESNLEALGLHNLNLATKQDLAMTIKEQMVSIPNDFDNQFREELKKAIQSQIAEELMALIKIKVDEMNQMNQIHDSDASKVIAAAIAKYDADKTGLFDFASETAGASVVSIRCSETYTSQARRLSVLGIPIWTFNWGPRVAIQNGLIPGQCWAFKGSQGYLVIQLSRPMKPQNFSMEHISRNSTPNGQVDSAPKDFQVLGLRELHDPDPIQLGNFTYAINGTTNQFFEASLNLEQEMRLRFVELRILSNHGNMNYTCLYRFRVHGQN